MPCRNLDRTPLDLFSCSARARTCSPPPDHASRFESHDVRKIVVVGQLIRRIEHGGLALQLLFCFEVCALGGGLVSSTPE
jgi:hypothetical protein